MATTMTTPITIAYPAGDRELELRIEAGACRLHVAPARAGAETWISGTYEDPGGSIRLDTSVEGNRAWIQVGRTPADFIGLITGVPELWLEIGKARPVGLTIAAGASENRIDLGGLPITRLEINHGAGSMDVTFSEPVPVATTRMKFAVGAGKTVIGKLGNVNFEELSVEGGAASCTLDFSGSALTNGSARISTAMASVDVRVPAALAVEITGETLLGQPRVGPGFTKRGGTWLSPAASSGKPVQLRIRSTMVMGQLRLSIVPPGLDSPGPGA